MKLRKNAIISLLLALICFFAACDEAPAGELTLADFVYDTEIAPDHVITEEELAAMNKVWRAEFGKDLAATPEEAMKRQPSGDFYFGRYGRYFVFYRITAEFDNSFGLGSHAFTLPYGTMLFLTDDEVYDQQQMAAFNLFPTEYIDALYDCYENTYLSYKPDAVLREGEYVLTEADLAWMHGMFEHSPKYTGVDTLGKAMRREKDVAYYFGKFGDTVIVWNRQNYSEKKIFTLCGYEFNFYSGAVLFFDPQGLYKPETEGVEGIMIAEEWKAFYDHYVEYYVPLNSDPYVALEFTPELEKLTEDEMKKINEAYEAWNYEKRYSYYYEMYIAAKQTPADAAKNADSAAYTIMGYDPHRFFNEENFKTYQYFGKKGSKIFLATQDSYDTLTVFEVAGYKFILDGAESDVFVCENGKVTPLAEAYEKGTVTKADVAFAHERHLAYRDSLLSGREAIDPPTRLKIGEPYRESPITLTEDEQREIVWEYIANSSDLEYEINSTYAVRCYGKFGNVYAVMIDGPWMYTDALRNEVIAGYTFSFHNGQRMRIYKEGDFYSLNKAYELGIISEEDLVAIEWSKSAPFTYTTEFSPVKLEGWELYTLVEDYIKYCGHAKDTVYSIRCYGHGNQGNASIIDRSDIVFEPKKTSETVAGFEFIYPTEQKMTFFLGEYKPMSLAEAYEQEYLTPENIKKIHETYRAAHPELYN